MMENRTFPFESIVQSEENDITVELGVDKDTDIEFNFEVDNQQFMTAIFQTINELVIIRDASIELSKVEYKDWLANELIRRITKDSSIYDSKPDALKEVLQELQQRRNKLIKQINKQMTFIENTKSKIDEMKKIRANHWKKYRGPVVILRENSLNIDYLTEDKLTFFSCKVSFETFKEEIGDYQQGYGWLEFSKNFSEDLKALHPSPNGNYIITNTKPRTDIRVMRRTEESVYHLMKYESKWYETFSNFRLGTYFGLHDRYKSNIRLSKSMLFSLVELSLAHFSDGDEINIELRPGEGDIFYELDRLVIQNEEVKISRRTTVSYHFFTCIQHQLYLVDHAVLIVNFPFFPNYLKIVIGDNFVLMGSNSNIPSLPFDIMKLTVQTIITDKMNSNDLTGIEITEVDDMDPETTIWQLYNGKLGIDPETRDTFEQILTDTKIRQDLSYKEKEAIQVYRIYKSKIYHFPENKNLVFEGENVNAEVDYTFSEGITNMQCNCGKDHTKFRCPHILSMIIYFVLEVLIDER